MHVLLAGMNSGVMLFRNTRWSREFLQGIAEIGLIPEPFLGQVCFVPAYFLPSCCRQPAHL